MNTPLKSHQVIVQRKLRVVINEQVHSSNFNLNFPHLVLFISLWMGVMNLTSHQLMADSYTTGPYLNGKYEYENYNLLKMDPQITGWPISDAERAYCNIGESDRRPGKETPSKIQQMKYVPTTPAAQGGDWWLAYHGNLVSMLDQYRNDHGSKLDILFVGDSITQQWCGDFAAGTYDPVTKLQPFNNGWKSQFGAYTAVNIGIGGDRTQSVLWRLDHDGVKGLNPRLIVLAIGHNNMFFTGETGIDTAARGILCCVQNLLEKFPNAHILVVKILPCFNTTAQFYKDAKLINSEVDKLKLETNPRVHLMPDMWNDWIGADGNPKPELFKTGDGEPVHPSQDFGYPLYAKKLYPVVKGLLDANDLIYFSSGSDSVMENKGGVRVTVRRLGGANIKATVDYSTGTGTASAGVDYTPVSGTLVWAVGDSSDRSFVIPLKNNTLANSTKTIPILLTNPTGAKLGTPAASTLSILDDDQVGSITLSQANQYNLQENGGNVTFSASRVGGSKGAASVKYATAGGTAQAASDFTTSTGTLNWTDGDSADKTFTVPILNDGLLESLESFTLTLSGATGALLGEVTQATLTIMDDEIPPFTVYGDTYAGNWVTNGWDSTEKSTTSVKNGVAALEITINKSGGARGPLSQSNFDTTPYESVSFWLNPGSVTGQKLMLRAYSDKTPTGFTIDLAGATANVWKQYTVNLADIGVADSTKLSAFRFVDQGGASVGKPFYIDDFTLNLKKLASGTLASVSTAAVSGIMETGATFGGEVTSAGGPAVKERGVCWSTIPNPTTANFKSSAGSGIGAWSSSTSGLLPGTTYHVRAYAINNMGVAYGANQTFTTASLATPTLSTTSATGITAIGATSGGVVSSDGGSAVTERGVCWNTLQNPTISQSKASNGVGVGSFTSVLTSLSAGTSYYLRAYATNSQGTSYGEQLSFSTLASVADFTSWAAAQGLSGTSAALTADPDGDGMNNLLEYGLGIDPRTDSTAKKPVISVSGGNLSLTYPKDPSKKDITYRVEASTDLKVWTTVGINDLLVSTLAGIETRQASVAMGVDAKKFLRLVVVKN